MFIVIVWTQNTYKKDRCLCIVWRNGCKLKYQTNAVRTVKMSDAEGSRYVDISGSSADRWQMVDFATTCWKTLDRSI